MKKPDLLILIAIWEFITSFVVFIGIVWLLPYSLSLLFLEHGETGHTMVMG